jgi:hypothetical protein
MKMNITLSIPDPCAEKWENFTRTATGGFCSSCQSVVVDFSKMTDAEIVDFLSNKPRVCGRLRADQLRSYVYKPVPKISPGMMLLKAGLLSLVLLAINKPAAAQTSAEKTRTEITSQKANREKALALSDTVYRVKGSVISDEDHSALAGVNVLLQGSTAGTMTDEKGKFEFPKKLKAGDVLFFSFIGLETQVFTVPKTLNNPLEIQMKMEFILMGKVQMIDATAKPSALHRWWTKVRNVF